uniref:KIB1-4 beta-propeller domain-containing protein n=1 Tax=Oryza punctata TaxID=4537 RepID=A0A0E0MHF9_ORYPU
MTPSTARARVPLPADARGAVCRGAIGSWLALAPPTPFRQLTPAHLPRTPPPDAPFLIKAFSLERVPLPIWRRGGAIRKVILSSAPDSRATTTTCVVAVLAYKARRIWGFDVVDIAFHGGGELLYLLDRSDRLHRVAVHESGVDSVAAALHVERCPPLTTMKPAWAFKCRDERSNLVELDGALVMAWRHATFYGSSRAMVFTPRHDDDGGAHRCWTSVSSSSATHVVEHFVAPAPVLVATWTPPSLAKENSASSTSDIKFQRQIGKFAASKLD